VDTAFNETTIKEFSLVLGVLNFLNSIKIVFNKDSINHLKETINKKKEFLLDKKRHMSILAVEDLMRYIGLNNYLYFSYILDRRTRIYVKNIPINPQLEKILRPLLLPQESNDFNKIYKSFIDKFSKLYEIREVFTFMDYIDILFNLFEKKILRVFNKLDILKINSIYS